MNTTEPIPSFPYTFEFDWHEALVRTWHCGLLLRSASTRFFADKAISVAQFDVLAGLYAAAEPPNQQTIADRLAVDKSAISGLLTRMERAGLIQRTTDPADRRRMAVELTDLGREIYEELEEPYLQVVRSIMSQIAPKTIKSLNKSLEALRVSVQTHLQEEEERG